MSEVTEEPRTAAEIAEEAGAAQERDGSQEAQDAERDEGGKSGVPEHLKRAAREARENADGDVVVLEDDPSIEARDAAARGDATPDEWAETTEWLLSDEPTEVITRKLRVRIGGSDEDPRFASFIVGAISMDTIRLAERDASGANRAQRRGGTGNQKYDEQRANLRVIVEATLKPDLKEISGAKGVADPTELLQKRLSHRPGVIAQIAGQVMAISGFDDNDVVAAGQ
jgi:hypothetical protein